MRNGWLLALGLSIGSFGVLGVPASAPAADSAEKEKWGEHMGDLPFVVGYEKGMKAAATSGLPPLYFFTATW